MTAPTEQSPPPRTFATFARNSPWFLIALLVHVIVAFVLAVVYVEQKFEKEATFDIEMNVAEAPEAPMEPIEEIPEPIERAPIPKNEERELTEFEEQNYEPTDEPAIQDDRAYSETVGDPNEPPGLPDLPPGAPGGTSIGVGVGPGHHGEGVSSFVTRRVGHYGGGGGPGGKGRGATQQTEKAVLDGLRWLCRHQQADGSWSAERLLEVCSTEGKCVPMDAHFGSKYTEGLTGLALLAFLGAGYAHDAKQTITDPVTGKKYVIGEVVKEGLKFLRDSQQADGSFSSRKPFVYNEALATMAMSEAYGLTRARSWKNVAEKGVDFLVQAQKLSPFVESGPATGTGPRWGWRYDSLADAKARLVRGELTEDEFALEAHDADLSVTCWAIMALKSARMAGIDVPGEAFQGGLAFAQYVSNEDGQAGYQLPEHAGKMVSGPGDHYLYHTGTMTALSSLIRIFVASDPNDRFLDRGAAHLVVDLPEASGDGLSIDYYYWYHASLALHQYDGPDSTRGGKKGTYWDQWNKTMIDTLVKLQDPGSDPKSCSRGGWVVPDRWSIEAGPIYSTAISTLNLEVYYRYENAFGVAKRASTKRAEAAEVDDDAAARKSKPESDER